MVFNPIEPHYIRYPQIFRLTKDRKFPWIVPVLRIGTYNVQGAFMKRQEEVSEVFKRSDRRSDYVKINYDRNDVWFTQGQNASYC